MRLDRKVISSVCRRTNKARLITLEYLHLAILYLSPRGWALAFLDIGVGYCANDSGGEGTNQHIIMHFYCQLLLQNISARKNLVKSMSI